MSSLKIAESKEGTMKELAEVKMGTDAHGAVRNRESTFQGVV